MRMQLFTIPETAKLLRVGTRTVQKLKRAGKLRPVRIGRRVLFAKEAIDEFLSASQTAMVAGPRA